MKKAARMMGTKRAPMIASVTENRSKVMILSPQFILVLVFGGVSVRSPPVRVLSPSCEGFPVRSAQSEQRQN